MYLIIHLFFLPFPKKLIKFLLWKNLLVNENGRNDQRNNLMLVKC